MYRCRITHRFCATPELDVIVLWKNWDSDTKVNRRLGKQSKQCPVHRHHAWIVLPFCPRAIEMKGGTEYFIPRNFSNTSQGKSWFSHGLVDNQYCKAMLSASPQSTREFARGYRGMGFMGAPRKATDPEGSGRPQAVGGHHPGAGKQGTCTRKQGTDQ